MFLEKRYVKAAGPVIEIDRPMSNEAFSPKNLFLTVQDYPIVIKV
jgi:hypothetical protein